MPEIDEDRKGSFDYVNMNEYADRNLGSWVSVQIAVGLADAMGKLIFGVLKLPFKIVGGVVKLASKPEYDSFHRN